jgi:hypothetical protein
VLQNGTHSPFGRRSVAACVARALRAASLSPFSISIVPCSGGGDVVSAIARWSCAVQSGGCTEREGCIATARNVIHEFRGHVCGGCKTNGGGAEESFYCLSAASLWMAALCFVHVLQDALILCVIVS